jgi:UDP-N-acetylglucosamine:LPS N-acetylglucosamine transferase
VGNLVAVNHLNTHDLEEAILSSEIVIARSGYSTVMDLFTLGKKAIFVPTPQQPEQLYLANLLSKQCLAVSELQEDFSLQRALDKSGSFSGFKRSMQGNELLNSAIDAILK